MPSNMMRWIAFYCLFIAAGCTSQLGVLVEETNYIGLSDFDGSEVTESPEIAKEQPMGVNDSTNQPTSDVVLAEIIEEEFELRKVGVPVTVEQLIGKVNGRPIYANSVLEPVEDKIQAVLRRENMTQTEFTDYVIVELYKQVRELVKRDLLLSEANSGMSPELAYGLFAVIGQMRKDLASTQGGSKSQMRQLAKEQEDESVDTFLESNKEQLLIDKIYREKVWPNVNVTWRDIQRAFEKVYIEEIASSVEVSDSRIEEILVGLKSLPLEAIPAANGSIVLGRIRLDIDDPRVETVKSMLDEDRPFSEVASEVGIEHGGIWETYVLKKGGLSALDLSQVVKDGLIQSQESNHLFSRTTSKSVFWFAVLEINEPISLYNKDIQIAVRNQLRSQQFYLEENRFLESIWSENGMLEVEDMAARVAKVAIQRYFQ